MNLKKKRFLAFVNCNPSAHLFRKDQIYFLYFLPTRATGGQRMGAVVSSLPVVSATPSFSGRGLITLFPCSSIGSHAWETVLHELLRPESFS